MQVDQRKGRSTSKGHQQEQGLTGYSKEGDGANGEEGKAWRKLRVKSVYQKNLNRREYARIFSLACLY
jgi:hypothetical protein